ncbi:TRMB [Hepatospora eriocheir]|uniref:tRNA (guanine(46)-N(7))-methyltransferase n=1 Tax=Hepatospora eriocheir TaxID=1081669 RepID=A0A1X0QBM7_9MICR|nr:TRMB [Hepatospora eriocheir]
MSERERKSIKTISKRNYRSKTYGNAFKMYYEDLPNNPYCVNWSNYFKDGKAPTYIELGCGYGKFLFRTSELFPEKNVLGFELRNTVYNFVSDSIIANNTDNCAVMRYNALLFLPNILKPNTVERFFILYPDPRVQMSIKKGRLINKRLFAVLEYLLIDGGEIFVSTDLENYHKEILEEFEEFNKINREEREFLICLERETVLKDGQIEIDKSDREIELIENCYKNTDEALRAGLKSGKAFCTIFKYKKYI